MKNVNKLLSNQTNIRNLSVIAHVDHGKTTLVDNFLYRAGMVRKQDVGEKRGMDTTKEEQDRIITIKSTGVSLVFTKDKEDYLINLVDSPGHVDFSSEVTAALRITDGALVVVDVIKGASVQTETVTRQALGERIRPVLHVNKVDLCIIKNWDLEDIYIQLESIAAQMNNLFSTYEDELLGDVSVHPLKGTMSFGSGKMGWAFTLPSYAKMLAKKMGSDPQKVLRRLWGNKYYDPETKKFNSTGVSKSGKPLQRYFVKMVLKPIQNVYKWAEANETEKLFKFCDSWGIKLKQFEKEFRGSSLAKAILMEWLPAGENIGNMMIEHLPSPIVAQKYRVMNLYTGPQDDEYAKAIRDADPNGPLMVFVSKQVPTQNYRNFICYGRVFSGTVKTGAKVFVLGKDVSEPGSKSIRKSTISNSFLLKGKDYEACSSLPCGNIVGLAGIDKSLLKSGTVTDGKLAFPIAPMKFSVSPIVQVAVEPKDQGQRKKFTDCLKLLIKSDPCLKTFIDPSTGQFIIAGAGELHIETSLNDLRKFLGDGVEIKTSTPLVSFSETVTTESSQVCLAKSANNHNRLYFTAEPMDEKTIKAIDDGTIANEGTDKARASLLVREYGWDKGEAQRIWCYGPENTGPNVVVNKTAGISYLNEIQSHVAMGFNSAVAPTGILCGEPLRGVRFNLTDAKLHPDSIHRGPGQIIQPTRRAMHGAQLCARPRIMEPWYLVEIECPFKSLAQARSIIQKRRGYEEEARTYNFL